jgi:hypothetical protein
VIDSAHTTETASQGVVITLRGQTARERTSPMASPIVPYLTAPFTKQIHPVWSDEGRRRRLIGFHAFLNDEILLVVGSDTFPQLFACYVDAEIALDEAALDRIEVAATTADQEALPFEPTVREIAEMRAVCEQENAWLYL